VVVLVVEVLMTPTGVIVTPTAQRGNRRVTLVRR
jgi:hypothetical protein